MELQKSQNFNKNENYEKVKIRNFSKKTIPPEIENILCLGLDHPVGGIPRKNVILNEFELFFS